MCTIVSIELTVSTLLHYMYIKPLALCKIANNTLIHVLALFEVKFEKIHNLLYSALKYLIQVLYGVTIIL